MWKQYTRETPARKGWALGAMIVAFLGTVGLAKLMVDSRTATEGVGRHKQAITGWPFQFTLPNEYRWGVLRQPPQSPFSAGGRSREESVHYHGQSASGGTTRLFIRYYKMPTGTSLQDAAAHFNMDARGAAETQEIGPLRWLIPVIHVEGPGAQIAGVACSPEGVAIHIEFTGPGSVVLEFKIFESICRSIEFVD